MNRRSFLAAALAAVPRVRIPPKTVVLTLDDAVKSHRVFVAPLLKDLKFQATFFVTHRWMDDGDSRLQLFSGNVRNAVDLLRVQFIHRKSGEKLLQTRAERA